MTKTERVLAAFRLLLDADDGVLTSRALSVSTGSPVKVCARDITLMRRFVPLAQVGAGSHVGWALPERGLKCRAEVAYDLRAAGLSWSEAAAKAGYATVSGARATVNRFALRTRRPWPPGAGT